MEKLLNLIIYIFQNYPNPSELSKPRLVKIIYLIDWRSNLVYNKSVTDIKWFFNHYGPYVEEVINLMRNSKDVFEINSYNNSFGGISDKIVLKEEIKKTPIKLEDSIQEVTNFVIHKTYDMTWSDFINLIYSTYPIKSSPKYSYLDLNSLSVEYKKYLSQKGITLI